MNLNDGLCRLLTEFPATGLIANDHSEKRIADGLLLSYSKGTGDQAWTVSLYAALVQAGRDELVKLPHFQAATTGGLITVLARLLRLGQIDRTVAVQNFGLSTNLYSRDFLNRPPAALRAAAQAAYPHTAVIIRSLNAAHHRDLMDALQQDGWRFLLTRQIYLTDTIKQITCRSDSKRDAKLLDDGRYRFRRLSAASADADFQAALDFYNRLYLGKYSTGNVRFTHLWLRETVARDLLALYLMECTANGAVAGCAGMICEEGRLTTPVLGYDLSLPQNEALYRRLSAFIVRYCAERNLRQHWSGGAAGFKKSRGAVPELEYTAVYTRHLPPHRRAVWRLLEKLSNGPYRRLLEKNGL